MSEYRLTDADRAAFDRDGYVLKRGWFSAAEVARMNAALANDASIAANVAHVSDSGGASTELALWNHPGDDIFGRVARSERVAGGIAALLGGPVYHYHSKLTMKRPQLGGAWDWHQDYGYWYNNGCLFPDMGSVFIALDPCRRVNGCLEVLRGSHHMGRIDHGRVGGQTGADADRVKVAMAVLDHVYCEMDPGDALFFHSNTLHASGRNSSDQPRNVLLCCYNRVSNNPTRAHHHPQVTPLDILPDTAIMAADVSGGLGLRFYDAGADATGDVKVGA